MIETSADCAARQQLISYSIALLALASMLTTLTEPSSHLQFWVDGTNVVYYTHVSTSNVALKLNKWSNEISVF